MGRGTRRTRPQGAMRKYAGAGAGKRVAYWKKGVRHAWRTQAPRPAAWRVSRKRGTPRIRNAEATWRAGNAGKDNVRHAWRTEGPWGATPRDVALLTATPKTGVAGRGATATQVRHAVEDRTPRGVRGYEQYATRARVAVERKSVAARPSTALRRTSATDCARTDVAATTATSQWKAPRHEAWRGVRAVDRIVERCGMYAGA